MTDAGKSWDVIIIGGGPAGLSAALWCCELGFETVLLEKEKDFGGQLRWTYNSIGNYLGRAAVNGAELRDAFLEQSSHLPYERILNADVLSIRLDEKTLKLTNGEQHESRIAIILATGVRRRRLDVPGEQRLSGRGVLRSGVAEKEKVAGKNVVIVGGGDSALENALLLSEVAAHVSVVHRRSEFTARTEFQTAASSNRKIALVTNSSIISIHGETDVEAVTLTDNADGIDRLLSAEAILVRIGFDPNTELFQDQVLLDEKGYVQVDAGCRTSVHGVFAVGDVAHPSAPTISTAVGTGAMVAKLIKNQISKI